MASVLLAGEAMGLMIAQEEGPLGRVENFTAAVAGAELNVAIGLARLGHRAAYLTRLGRDPFGSRVYRLLEANGVDTALLAVTDEHPTGFMLKSKVSHGDPQTVYFRRGSAASAMDPADADSVALEGFDALHLTGILPALSDSCREAAFRLAERARRAGLKVFFDPNLRPSLWPDKDTMARVLRELAAKADYVLPGIAEGEALLGVREPERIAKRFHELGAGAVVVKVGAEGAYASDGCKGFLVPGYKGVHVVDTVGAGDGFAAGVVSAVCEGLTLWEAVKRGNAIGAIQVGNPGDNEGLPTKAELGAFMQSHETDAKD